MALDLSFPRDPYAEFYLKGDWHDLITDVRQSPAINIERGHKDEGGKPVPSKCTFTLDDGTEHGDGNYSPSNPTGQWFPDFGRNTPVRLGLKVGTDTFARTEASGWGTSPQNGPWNDAGFAETSSQVAGGVGQHIITDDLVFHFNYLSDVEVRDVEVAVTATIDSVADVTGGDLEPANIILRGQDISNYYLVRLSISSAEVATLRIMLNGSSTLAGPFTLPQSYSGQSWRVRAQMEGKTLRAKAWPTDVAEPLDWQLQNVRATPFGAGWVGVRSGVGSGNTNLPVTFSYDDVELRLPRFTGETSSVKPSADVSLKNRTVAVECGTVFRRRDQGKTPVQSVIRRAIDQQDNVAYWSCEDGKNSTLIAPSVGPPMYVRNGISRFAQSDRFLASQPLPYIDTAWWEASLPNHITTGEYQFRWVQHVPGGQESNTVFLYEFIFTGSAYRWHVQLETNGSFSVRAFDQTGIIVDDTHPTPLTDKLAYMQFSVQITGFVDLLYILSFFDIDGGVASSYTSGNALNQSIGRCTDIRVIGGASGLPGPKDAMVGHISAKTSVTGLTGFGPQLAAYRGETAAERMIRLASENGLPLIGDITTSDDTALVGPQQTDTLVRLLTESARTDGGVFSDARGDNTFAYTPLAHLYDRDAIVLLDYTAGHIAPEFVPVHDDRHTRNEVTAKARSGNEVTVSRTTGPLNTQDPGSAEGAVGAYDVEVDVNPDTFQQLTDIAGWALHLGTVDEPRFPNLRVNLASSGITNALATQVLDTNVAGIIAIDNLSQWHIYDRLHQLCLGYTEIIDTKYLHDIIFNNVPYSPYNVGSLDDGELRLDSDTSTLNEDLDTTETSIEVATTGGTLWITTATVPADFPFDIVIGGERMTVTAITGASSPQTFTVTRSVNGVVKEHSSGDKVSLYLWYPIPL